MTSLNDHCSGFKSKGHPAVTSAMFRMLQDYAPDTCVYANRGVNSFTPGQIRRMQEAWVTFRKCKFVDVGYMGGTGVRNCWYRRVEGDARAKCRDHMRQVQDKMQQELGLPMTVEACPCVVVKDKAGAVTTMTETWHMNGVFDNDLYEVVGWFGMKRRCWYSVSSIACCYRVAIGSGLPLGGESCTGSCPTGSPCGSDAICASRVCTSNKCAAPTCADGIQNGDGESV